MNSGLLAVSAAGAAALVFVLYKLHAQNNPVMASANLGDSAGGASGGSPAGGANTPPPSGIASGYNGMIAQAAKVAGIDPVLLKAIAGTESDFNPDAINPEKDFMLNGVSYAQYDRAGQRELVRWIKDANDPATIGLNPSCGIAQVRVSNGKKFISGLDPWDLFDPSVCLEAAALLIADDNIGLENADKYNVGGGLNWLRGVRNLPYREKVQTLYARFAGDF